MKEKNIIYLLLFTVLITVSGFLYQAKGQANGLWSGTVTEHSMVVGNPSIKAESMVTINYNNNVGTGTYSKNDKLTIDGKVVGTTNCTGTDTIGFSELSIDNDEKTYTIQTSALKYTCTYLDGSSDSGEDYITIAYEPWDENPRVLKGSKTLEADVAGGKLVTTTTWNLVKQSDVELIVTPQKYDTWLPIPGRDEQTPGSEMMTVNLELKDRNGRPASEKAKSFELILSNTSKEKGITINMPLTPAAQQLPDLRFQPQQGAVITQDGQLMTIYCPAGCVTTSFKIACFDGGAWTTLTAKAVLETDTIKGNLLESGGDEEILIPKRNPESKIATAWLNQNGNPGEMDDKESSDQNYYNGDGLTAYEEYRGVISKGRFKRLDPKKKEVGIDIIRPDLSFFSEGIKLFENATKLTAVIFHEDLNEIGPDRRLNKNAETNHDYDQYVLRLYKSEIPKEGVMGKAYGGPATPAKTFAVVIDYPEIVGIHLYWESYARTFNMQPMPFTLKEFTATIIAHELGHGVNCWHHGGSRKGPIDTARRNSNPAIHIFSNNRREIKEITIRPYTLDKDIGMQGNQQSGDLSCVMVYSPSNEWAYHMSGGDHIYYMVPVLPIAKSMCNSGSGTSINSTPNYFGNATRGNCLAQVNLRN